MDQRKVALEPPRVEVPVQPHHQQRDVDVAGERCRRPWSSRRTRRDSGGTRACSHGAVRVPSGERPVADGERPVVARELAGEARQDARRVIGVSVVDAHALAVHFGHADERRAGRMPSSPAARCATAGVRPTPERAANSNSIMMKLRHVRLAGRTALGARTAQAPASRFGATREFAKGVGCAPRRRADQQRVRRRCGRASRGAADRRQGQSSSWGLRSVEVGNAAGHAAPRARQTTRATLASMSLPDCRGEGQLRRDAVNASRRSRPGAATTISGSAKPRHT